MQIVRFNGTVGEFDSLNWESGLQGFEQWLNKRAHLNPKSDKVVVVDIFGNTLCTRWIIYDDLSVSDLKSEID